MSTMRERGVIAFIGLPSHSTMEQPYYKYDKNNELLGVVCDGLSSHQGELSFHAKETEIRSGGVGLATRLVCKTLSLHISIKANTLILISNY